MALTAHDLMMDADLFRRAYPRWPSVDPLSGPFLSSLQLTDYSDDPAFAILPRKAEPMDGFPLDLPADDTDDPAKPWRVMDEPGNTLDCPDRASARQVMEDQLVSSALYSRNMVTGEWSQYETLLRG